MRSISGQILHYIKQGLKLLEKWGSTRDGKINQYIQEMEKSGVILRYHQTK